MASVENSNRFSAIELDDEGNIVKQKVPKKEKAPKEEEAKQQQQVQPEPKDRTKVSDRNRRGGRGGGAGAVTVNENGVPTGEYSSSRGGRGRGGRGAHRGGYIGDGEKREFDRRGAPNNDRPRGRARKGGVGLGRYDGEENNRRNRPNRNEVDPTVEPTTPENEVVTSTNDASPSDTPATTEETPVVETAVEATVTEPGTEEEPDTSLTLEEFQAQQRSRIVDSDVNRELRRVEINDKQWSKISKALDGGKKKFKLNAKGEEVPVEEEERQVTGKKQNKKNVVSLDEFVGTSPVPQTTSSASSSSESSSYSRGGRGGASSEFRGRGRGRGGASGEFRGRGRGRGGRGGFRGPSVAIDDKNAFPDLSAAAKKN